MAMKLNCDEQQSFYHGVKCLIYLDSDHISSVPGKKINIDMVYCFSAFNFQSNTKP